MPISDSTSSSQLFRLREIMNRLSTRNLNANLICLASCSSSDKLSTEHKKTENTFEDLQYEGNIHMYYKSNLLFESKNKACIYQFKATDRLSISEGQRPDCY